MISPTTGFNTSNIIYIRGGIEGAKNYPVTPGYTALLLDEEAHKFFIKKIQVDGSPNLRVFNFSEEATEVKEADSSKFATKEDFNLLMEEIKKLQSGKRNSYKHKNYRRNYGNGKSYEKSI